MSNVKINQYLFQDKQRLSQKSSLLFVFLFCCISSMRCHYIRLRTGLFWLVWTDPVMASSYN